MAPADTKKAETASTSCPLAKQGPPRLSDYKEILDESTFEQILEMDDDEEDRDFSKSIVYGFFDQAESTYKKIQKEIDAKNLDELSSLVKDGCEKIQNFVPKDETGIIDQPDTEVCLKAIKKTLDEVEVEYRKVEKLLRRYYGEDVKEEEEKPEQEKVKEQNEEEKPEEETKKETNEIKETKEPTKEASE
ncbi:hypothetical protein PDIDSM_1848 [Penicillium digitatum]|nr:hypothetical protein PDIDSM_1848 [Penicillium digitatum]